MSVAIMMCAGVRDRLQSLLDDELDVADYAQVQAHLSACARCSADLDDYRAVGNILRSSVDPTSVPMDALALMSSRVVSLTAAEARQSLRARVTDAFGDMRYVLACGGALAATLLCAVALAGILNGATYGNADSLAALMARMSERGTTENPFSVDPRILPPTLFEGSMVMPVVLVDNVPYSVRDDDYAFQAVVTPDGNVAGVEMLSGRVIDPRALELLRSIHGARLVPARLKDGRRVAVSFVWLHTDVTIKPNKSL
jgi:hypothetical protein